MSSLGFSYAQAARGLNPSSTVSSNPTSSASSEHGAAKDISTPTESSTSHNKSIRNMAKSDRDVPTQSNSSRSTSRTGQVDTAANRNPFSQALDAEVDSNEASDSKKSSVDLVSPTLKDHEADEKATEDAEEGQGENRQAASVASNEKEKTKDVDDDWEKVSIPSVTTDKEMKAAPIPVVNIWQQRKEAAQAKLKEQAAQRTVAPAAAQSRPRPQTIASDESRKKASNREEPSATGLGRHTSNARNARDQSSSVSPRSVSQQNGKPVSQPPPVDTESWPTPESAITDSGRRSSILEKTDRGEVVDVNASGRKNKWHTLPFVPSVKFETQIPAARRGGRPATTARARGGANGQGERSTEKSEPGSMAPPPLPKTVSDQDRGRKGNAARSARASSVPTESGAGEGQQKRPAASTAKASEAADSEMMSAINSDRPAGIGAPSKQDPSRSSSRHAPQTANTNRISKPDIETSSTQDIDAVGSPTRQSQQRERASVSNFDSYRMNEQGEKPQAREGTKDRTSNAQKSENWRSERRGDRSERGRGSYRGRGNHSGYNNNPSFTSPLPQNGFDALKQGGQPEPRSRQTSQPFSTPLSFGANRNNPRSQSIPITMLSGGYYQPAPGFTQTLSPIQTDMALGTFGQMPNAMPGGIMSAMPYNEQLNGFALFSMVVSQLEYYFSVNNLCKDMFLRKHMDSQGFVPLRVIGEFKRIKSMLGDSQMSYDQLRGMAQQARTIEFVIGDDGEDRLRNREDWEKFVLPMEDRLPEAQNDGPQIRQGHFRESTGITQDFSVDNGNLRSAPPDINGFDDSLSTYATSTQFQKVPVAEPQSTEQWVARVGNADPEDGRRTATTSPLSKVQSPSHDSRSILENFTNGHRASMSSNVDKESTFPDESVVALKVVVKDPEYEGDDDGAGIADEPIPTRASGLRGGAGSPEPLERIRSLQFGQSANTPSKGSEQTIYFTQEGPPPHLMRPGYIHEDYLSLREKALSQRAEDHFDGATGVLYPLWAEFLPRPNQFNVGMYEDFKIWALEDQAKGNDNGKKHLVRFYDAMLSAKSPMTERVAADVVEVARSESGATRPTWLKLRAAWRNGATNLKTRKRLTDLLTSEEQAELERGA